VNVRGRRRTKTGRRKEKVEVKAKKKARPQDSNGDFSKTRGIEGEKGRNQKKFSHWGGRSFAGGKETNRGKQRRQILLLDLSSGGDILKESEKGEEISESAYTCGKTREEGIEELCESAARLERLLREFTPRGEKEAS